MPRVPLRCTRRSNSHTMISVVLLCCVTGLIRRQVRRHRNLLISTTHTTRWISGQMRCHGFGSSMAAVWRRHFNGMRRCRTAGTVGLPYYAHGALKKLTRTQGFSASIRHESAWHYFSTGRGYLGPPDLNHDAEIPCRTVLNLTLFCLFAQSDI